MNTLEILKDRVFVVIPAYRCEKTLGLCLTALRQAGDGLQLEVSVVYDSMEPLGFAECARNWTVRELRSDVSHSAGAARNCGAAECRQGILVFLDADVLVSRDGLQKLIAPLQEKRAEATVGNYSWEVDGLSFLQKYKQLYIATVYSRREGYLKNEYWTALGAIRGDVFWKVGGFHSHYQGAAGEDTELGQRISKDGDRILAVPEAFGRHLHEYTLVGLFRNDLRKGTQSMLNGLRNRSIGDHRHSSKIDMLAVASAYMATFGGIVLNVFFGNAAIQLAMSFLILWMIFRRDILRGWAHAGLAFLCGCIPLAFALDIVRGLAAISGGLQYLIESSSSTLKPQRSLVFRGDP